MHERRGFGDHSLRPRRNRRARDDSARVARSIDGTGADTPFAILYALHEALVRPYPGHQVGPSLAESWSESADSKTYEFKLRSGLTFHNGDPITTEDVKFSFERYNGAASRTLKDNVERVEIVDPLVVRFHLKAPWPTS